MWLHAHYLYRTLLVISIWFYKLLLYNRTPLYLLFLIILNTFILLIWLSVITFEGHFREVIKRAHQEPVMKYATPQTEAQEIGWITKPLVSVSTKITAHIERGLSS